MDLRDEQWAILKPLIPVKAPRADGKGRPRRDDREVLEGVLWVLRSGAAWQDLPDRYPSPATCHRRFQEWRQDGVLEAILQALTRDLDEVLNILRQAGTFTARSIDTLGPDFELNILYTDPKGNDLYGGFDLEFHDYKYYAAVITGSDTVQDICVFPTDYVDSTPS